MTQPGVGAQLKPIVNALATLDPIQACKSVWVKKICIVEFNILAVFVRNLLRIAAIGADHDTSQRFDDKGRAIAGAGKRKPPVQTDTWEYSPGDSG